MLGLWLVMIWAGLEKQANLYNTFDVWLRFDGGCLDAGVFIEFDSGIVEVWHTVHIHFWSHSITCFYSFYRTQVSWSDLCVWMSLTECKYKTMLKLN